MRQGAFGCSEGPASHGGVDGIEDGEAVRGGYILRDDGIADGEHVAVSDGECWP